MIIIKNSSQRKKQMKTLSKAIAIASLVTAGALASQAANAEVSYNAAVVSDYVWRGESQNDNGFAFQGGADTDVAENLSVGVWASTIMLDADTGEDTFEVDLYASYGFALAGMDASVGVVNYQYDESDSSTEFNVAIEKDALSAMLSIDSDGDYNYLEGGYSMDLPKDLALDLSIGYAMPDIGDDSLDFGATVGKDVSGYDVALGLGWASEDRTGDDADTVLYLSASKEF
jgi:uncharacterized protein (TIGR02001 family)